MILKKKISHIQITCHYYPKISGKYLSKALQIPFLKEVTEKHRILGSKIIQQHLTPRQYIKDIVESFCMSSFKNSFVIGVHIRATDSVGSFGREEAPNIDDYCAVIDKKIDSEENVKIFLATDDTVYIEPLVKIYGDRIYHQDCLRHEQGEVSTLVYKGGYTLPTYIIDDPARNGEEVMIDFLLLCESNYFVHNVSSVSRSVLLARPNLDSINVKPLPNVQATT